MSEPKVAKRGGYRPNAGRPVLPEGKRATEVLRLCVTPNEAAAIRARASLLGLSVAGLLRVCLGELTD